MNAPASRLATLFALLIALGLSSAFAAPIARPTVVHTAAQAARSVKLATAAKLRDRDEKGRFLPKVSDDAIRVRAYQKWEASGRSGGHDQQDYAQAKRELQDEKMTQNRAAREAKK